MADEKDLMSKLARVRQAFGKQLPAKVEELHQLWAMVYQSQSDGELLQEFHRQAHALSGSAGTFGLYSVSEAAKSLECLVVSRMASTDLQWASDEIEMVNSILQMIIQQTRQWQGQIDLPASAKEVAGDEQNCWNNLLILVDEDRSQLGVTASILVDYGYRVASYASLEEVSVSHLDACPGALIVHKPWGGEQEQYVKQLQSLKLRCSPNIPLVLISSRDDAQVRLAAVRAGAVRFFAKPVNYEKLACTLDGLTGKTISSPYRVLVVDDESTVADYYSAMLSEQGIIVRVSADPMQALADMDQFKPDLVLLDVYMPCCSGLELAAMIRQDDAWAQTPIVFISAETDIGRQMAAMDLGGDDFITKPVDKEHLVSALVARLKRARWVQRLGQDLQESLNLSEYQRIALDQHAIVSITDTKGVITHVNEKFCHVSGYSRDELIGKKHSIIQSGYHSREFFASMWKDISQGKVWHGEICNRAKGGHLYWVDSTIVPFLDERGRPYQYVAVRTDISHIKQVQNELIEAKENAERASRVKSRFLSSMSHELRTPLNAILGFTQVMELDPDEPLSGSQKDSLGEIEKAGKHLLELINDILDLAKIEDGRIDLQMRSLAVAELIESCLSMIAPLLARNSLTLVYDDTQYADLVVWADEVRLKQALLNLLSNACKYNSLEGTVEIACEQRQDGFLRIKIRDSGRGISADKLQGLFIPFNRLGAEASDIEGTGIGLVITKSLIELMGGQVGCESEEGIGSVFWVDIPHAEESEHIDHEDAATLLESPEFAEPQQLTVLYVEDNPANVRLMSRLLGRFPEMTLLTAHDGSLGLKLARSHLPDLVLLDINLPGMNGYEVLEELRRESPTAAIPVIGVSANASLEAIERAKKAGFNDYLTKPFDLPKLVSALRKVLVS